MTCGATSMKHSLVFQPPRLREIKGPRRGVPANEAVPRLGVNAFSEAGRFELPYRSPCLSHVIRSRPSKSLCGLRDVEALTSKITTPDVSQMHYLGGDQG